MNIISRGVIYIIIFVLFSLQVSAQTPTEADTDGAVAATSSSGISKEVEKLKSNLINKVAQIQKKELRVVSGKVTDLTKTSMKILSDDATAYTVTLDDVVTKYHSLSSGSQKDLERTDLEENDYVIVAGIVNDTKVTANTVYVDSHVLVGVGSITTVDKNDFSINITSTDREKYTADIETGTKILLLDSKTLALETAGFSKIKEGDSVHYILKVTGKETVKNRHSAQKLLIIPQEFFMK